jgi:hypothetical protein
MSLVKESSFAHKVILDLYVSVLLKQETSPLSVVTFLLDGIRDSVHC